MARLRSSMNTLEVRSTIPSSELRQMSRILDYGDHSPLPVVPPEMRSTGAAAMDADSRCLRSLSANATARAASMALAANSALGA